MLREGERRQQQAISLAQAIVNGRCADLEHDIRTALNSEIAKDKETKSKLDDLLNIMNSFNEDLANLTKEYLEKEQEVINILSLNEEQRDMMYFYFVPTTFKSEWVLNKCETSVTPVHKETSFFPQFSSRDLQESRKKSVVVTTSYENYWKEFLPQMEDSCRAYNKFEKTDEEILALLFPGLPKGAYPDKDTATKKFAELAANNRPYAKFFNLPEGVEGDPVKSSYENYWKEFLPQMGEACRAYNKFEKTDKEILAILFPGLPDGAYPGRETATKKFAELAKGDRTYARLFNPPE